MRPRSLQDLPVSNATPIFYPLLAALGLVACGGNQAHQRDMERMREQIQQLRAEVEEGAGRVQVLERQMDRLAARLEAGPPGAAASQVALPDGLRVVRVEPTAVEQEDEDSYAYIALAPERQPARPSPPSGRRGGVDQAPPLPTGVDLGNSARADAAFEEAERWFAQGKVREAIDAFDRFVREHPEDHRADNAALALGEAYLSLGMPGRALEAFEAVVARFPAGDAVPQALLRYGETSDALGRRAAARAAFQRLIERFPGSPAAVQARGRLGALDEGETG